MATSPLVRKLRRYGNALVYWLASFALACFSRVPLRVNLEVGRFLGGVAWYFVPKERRRIGTHLRIAYGEDFPQSDIDHLSKALFHHLGMCLFEVFSYRAFTSETIDHYVQSTGWKEFQEHRASGKGCILVGAHQGNWELAGAFFPLHGVPFNVVVRENPNPGLADLITTVREKWGMKVYARGGTAPVREALNVLKRGECLAVLMDQDTRVDGTWVPFFGKPAYTPTGPASIAMKTGVPVFIITYYRIEGPYHSLTITGPHYPDSNLGKEEAVQEFTARLTAILEAAIREHPEQWVWMHRRWRRQKEEADKR